MVFNQLVTKGIKVSSTRLVTHLHYLQVYICTIHTCESTWHVFHFIGFKYELALCLNGTILVPDLHRRESSLFSQFRVKGQPKEFFNYLLIDPMCLTSLDKTVLNDQQDDNEMFQSFVEAVFYIGKGKNSRSFQHLKDAKKKRKKVKVDRIIFTYIYNTSHSLGKWNVFLIYGSMVKVYYHYMSSVILQLERPIIERLP